LSTEMLKVIRSPEFAARMAASGCDVLGSTPAEFAKKISDETAKFAKIVKEGNVVVE
jgi:tripartite-type tricarboxylate transporter receptor subunit TctC